MIIFYDRNTGEIVGVIHGRVHPEPELNMWIGDKATTNRIVCQWKHDRYEDARGEIISRDRARRLRKVGRKAIAIWEPDTQPEVFKLLETDTWAYKGYVVESGKVIKKIVPTKEVEKQV